MKPLVIVATNITSAIPILDADYYGVDKGALLLLQQGIKMTYAIGDFDSISETEYQQIEKIGCAILHLNIQKNETDLEVAFDLAKKQGYKIITVYGALGGRLDHFYANLLLLQKYHSFFDITLIDEKHEISILTEQQKYLIEKSTHHYYSFFALKDARLLLQGFLYGKDPLTLHVDEIRGISNELIKEQGSIEVLFGEVLLIKSRD